MYKLIYQIYYTIRYDTIRYYNAMLYYTTLYYTIIRYRLLDSASAGVPPFVLPGRLVPPDRRVPEKDGARAETSAQRMLQSGT